MKEHPIIFSGPMIPALLDDRKTVTRRPIKPQPPAQAWWADQQWLDAAGMKGDVEHFRKPDPFDYAVGARVCPQPRCRAGVPGDELWVKETHYLYGKWHIDIDPVTQKTKWRFEALYENVAFPNDPPDVVCTKKTQIGWFKRPSIFMPRWASRIQLVVKSVRAERVQDITKADVFAEGITEREGCPLEDCHVGWYEPFADLWHAMYAKKPELDWDTNPGVWRVEFERKVK